MVGNNKQAVLKGIEATMQAVKLSDLLQDLVSRHGLTTLANEIDVDKSTLSRFKNGEGALNLENMEKLLEYGDAIMVTRRRYKRMMETTITMSEFLKEALGWH